jgi:hypothetical protein
MSGTSGLQTPSQRDREKRSYEREMEFKDLMTQILKQLKEIKYFISIVVGEDK